MRIAVYFLYVTSPILCFLKHAPKSPFLSKAKIITEMPLQMSTQCYKVNALWHRQIQVIDLQRACTKILSITLPSQQCRWLSNYFSMALKAEKGKIPRLCTQEWQIHLHNEKRLSSFLPSHEKDLDSTDTLLGIRESVQRRSPEACANLFLKLLLLHKLFLIYHAL